MANTVPPLRRRCRSLQFAISGSPRGCFTTLRDDTRVKNDRATLRRCRNERKIVFFFFKFRQMNFREKREFYIEFRR